SHPDELGGHVDIMSSPGIVARHAVREQVRPVAGLTHLYGKVPVPSKVEEENVRKRICPAKVYIGTGGIYVGLPTREPVCLGTATAPAQRVAGQCLFVHQQCGIPMT